jgi:protein involved in polysaccharide export with SLBB domain
VTINAKLGANWLTAVAFLLGVTACATTPNGAAESNPANTALTDGRRLNEYRLGLGDKVRVRVFGADQIGGEFQIDLSGSIDPPLVGVMKAEGRTPLELKEEVAGRLKAGGIVDDPQVSVELVAASPFFVLGEVEKSGQYPYFAGLNVVSAIATAGGFRYRADQERVLVRRRGQSSEIAVPTLSAAPIYPGDIVRVPGRFF